MTPSTGTRNTQPNDFLNEATPGLEDQHRAFTHRLRKDCQPESHLAMLPLEVAPDEDGGFVWARPDWTDQSDETPSEFIIDSLQKAPYWTWRSDVNTFFSQWSEIIE